MNGSQGGKVGKKADDSSVKRDVRLLQQPVVKWFVAKDKICKGSRQGL